MALGQHCCWEKLDTVLESNPHDCQSPALHKDILASAGFLTLGRLLSHSVLYSPHLKTQMTAFEDSIKIMHLKDLLQC